MEQADRRTTEWSTILMPLTPTGRLPKSGTPSRQVADFAADLLSKTRLFEPELVTPEFAAGEQGAAWLSTARSVRDSARRYPYRLDFKFDAEMRRQLEDEGVRDYASGLLGRSVSETFDAFFLYYEEGGFTPLHIDNGTYAPLNLLACLHRVRPEGAGGRRSATYFMESSSRVIARDLDPGQALWFHSSEIPHGRTPLGPGEEVIIMTISFREKEQ